MNQRQQEILDDIRIFMELSDEEYSQDEVKEILERIAAGCTPQMIAEDMELSEEKMILYLTVMRCKGLIAPMD